MSFITNGTYVYLKVLTIQYSEVNPFKGTQPDEQSANGRQKMATATASGSGNLTMQYNALLVKAL